MFKRAQLFERLGLFERRLRESREREQEVASKAVESDVLVNVFALARPASRRNGIAVREK